MSQDSFAIPDGDGSSQQNAQSTTVALFVSDVHLDASRPQTTQAFLQFLRQQASRCQQLYLLGDIFEYWAGDDDVDAAEHQALLQALAQLAAQGVQLFWMAGNRDFLLGAQFAARCHLQLLPETHILHFGKQDGKILLAHGDAQCTDDSAYMQFRAMVRQPAWQAQFLGKPLAERKAMIAAMREGSKMAQASKYANAQEAIIDVQPATIMQVMAEHDCQIMIHGHTHRPAHHQWRAAGTHEGAMLERHVLPDWECEAPRRADWRGGWIALHDDGRLEHVRIADWQPVCDE